MKGILDIKKPSKKTVIGGGGTNDKCFYIL